MMTRESQPPRGKGGRTLRALEIIGHKWLGKTGIDQLEIFRLDLTCLCESLRTVRRQSREQATMLLSNSASSAAQR